MLLLGYSILYKEYYLTRFNHQKNATHTLISRCAEETSSTDTYRVIVGKETQGAGARNRGLG